MNRANNDTSKLCKVTEAPYQFEGTKHVMTGLRPIDEKTLLTYELISLQIILAVVQSSSSLRPLISNM
jgi:hypothetical protein